MHRRSGAVGGDAAAPLTLGTAGHVDHGKTTLVAALTGVDTDRLPEEHARGLSIELGYAPLTLPSGRRLSVVDVPGHERFVRTMVAGATGTDLYLMTVAADDGVMPQTREHAAVLAGLGVEAGVVAVTKADSADPGPALAAAAELLPRAEAVAVSARTGAGLDQLLAALDRVAARLPGRAASGGAGAAQAGAAAGSAGGAAAGSAGGTAAGAHGGGTGDAAAVLHIDRVFTIRGAGTVVTGTLWAGSVGRGDVVTLLPGGRTARVRAVQVHDEAVERAAAGQRVAVNLTGVGRDEVARGDVLAGVGTALAPTYRVDVAIRLGPDVEHGDRVTVHHGTRETPARLAALGGRYWQLRLERPVVAAAGDRVIVRRIAPPDTLGGGIVLDAAPSRHGPSRDLLVRLVRIERGETSEGAGAAAAGAHGGVAGAAEGAAAGSYGGVAAADASDAAAVGAHSGVAGADAGGAAAEVRGCVSTAPMLDAAALALEARLREAGHEPPLASSLSDAERAALPALRAAGRVVRIGREMVAHADALAAVRGRVVAHCEAHGGAITVAEARDLLGTSRKFAQAHLEHLDAARVTRRDGDRHLLRRRTTGR